MSRVIRRRCDVPMARRKGLIPCDKTCKTCVACIETDEEYRDSHASMGRGSDPRLLARNLKRMGMF